MLQRGAKLYLGEGKPSFDDILDQVQDSKAGTLTMDENIFLRGWQSLDPDQSRFSVSATNRP